MKKKSLKLLTKSTLIYLLFTFVAFFSSAMLLTNEANKFINGELNHRYWFHEKKIEYKINHGRDIKSVPHFISITELDSTLAKSIKPSYQDTLIYNEDLDVFKTNRIKTTKIKAKPGYYKVSIMLDIDDYLKLKNNIFGALIPAFILLSIGIVLFNFLSSGLFFRPFNRILHQMSIYHVGQRSSISKINTSTSEFKKMQDLYHQMIDRIENDYQNLKEYTENMAHEMQTPLTIVRNKIENLIADDNVMKNQAETIKIIYDEINHLSKLGKTLNLLTKIENKEYNNTAIIQTKPVIEKHIESIRELAGLKSITINTKLDAGHIIWMDPFLFDIILKNMLRNAISYGTAEKPITIETNNQLLLISNYGEPLKKTPEHIFQRFYRQDSKKASLGLGLALVKKICDLNDIDINYQYENQQHIFQLINLKES